MRSSQGTAALIPACSQLYALSNPSPSLILPWTQVMVRCQGGLGITSGTSGMPPGGWRYVERSSRCGLVTRSSFRCVRKPAGPRQQDLLTRGDRTRIRHDTWTKRATHEEHLDRKSEDISRGCRIDSNRLSTAEEEPSKLCSWRHHRCPGRIKFSVSGWAQKSC